MNTLFEKIKQQRMSALKNEQSDVYTILTTLFAECQMVGKNKRNGDPTDDECYAVIKKFIEGQRELLKYRGETPEIHKELEIYNLFLPTQLSIDQINQEFDVLNSTAIGDVMKHFNTNYKNLFNGKQVSELFKTWMSNR